MPYIYIYIHRIIGKGGSTIEDIRGKSGAFVRGADMDDELRLVREAYCMSI